MNEKSTESVPLNWSEVPRKHTEMSNLHYRIDEFSSFSANYHPTNILVNAKTDQSSRWSSAANNNGQFITLALENVAILQTITFGKFHKVHVCNLKEFKVFAGLSKDNLIEVLHSGLRNDTENETFVLRHCIRDLVFPVKFVKIVPISAWGANFNFSIWYVELNGCDDSGMVQRALHGFARMKETIATKLCMKFLRKMEYKRSLEALKTDSGVALEDSFLEFMYGLLFSCQNDKNALALLEEYVDKIPDNVFESYIDSSCKYTPHWEQIVSTNELHSPQDQSCIPMQRGGHQMCVDTEQQKVYVFGGWNGSTDLNDFWSYDIKCNKWTLINSNCSANGGPSPRSCHKMVYHAGRKCIYILGKYIDAENRLNGNFSCDFHSYDISTKNWTKISDDTRNDGGPSLLYDHQMVVDNKHDCLIIFGGKSVEPRTSELEYSGLYIYHIATNNWELLRSDYNPDSNYCQFQFRIGHSMMIEETKESSLVYIFSGQRLKDYLNDLVVYEVESDEVIHMTKDVYKENGPDPGFTHRATLMPEKREIVVMSGLTRDKNSLLNQNLQISNSLNFSAAGGLVAAPIDSSPEDLPKNNMWCYSIRNQKWFKINAPKKTALHQLPSEPCPRFAYQFCYNPVNGTHYLFGGNPGDSTNTRLRLNDFWQLRLLKPAAKQIRLKIKFFIKRQHFMELINRKEPFEALEYLQTSIYPLVNHEDEQESNDFKRLARCLFEPLPINFSVVEARQQLYENILTFFPESLKQPEIDLINLLKW